MRRFATHPGGTYAGDVIVVVGSTAYRPADEDAADRAEGRAAAIARAAIAAGSRVQLVARVGDDPEGDRLVLALAREGIGHAAILRDAAERTRVISPPPVTVAGADEVELLADEPDDESFGSHGPTLGGPDIELAIRYLADATVVVSADGLEAGAAAALAGAASFAGAQLVLAGEGSVPASDDPSVTVFEAPASDPDGAYASMVGRYAAALDAGRTPADAFRAATSESGWESVGS